MKGIPFNLLHPLVQRALLRQRDEIWVDFYAHQLPEWAEACIQMGKAVEKINTSDENDDEAFSEAGSYSATEIRSYIREIESWKKEQKKKPAPSLEIIPVARKRRRFYLQEEGVLDVSRIVEASRGSEDVFIRHKRKIVRSNGIAILIDGMAFDGNSDERLLAKAGAAQHLAMACESSGIDCKILAIETIGSAYGVDNKPIPKLTTALVVKDWGEPANPDGWGMLLCGIWSEWCGTFDGARGALDVYEGKHEIQIPYAELNGADIIPISTKTNEPRIRIPKSYPDDKITPIFVDHEEDPTGIKAITQAIEEMKKFNELLTAGA